MREIYRIIRKTLDLICRENLFLSVADAYHRASHVELPNFTE